MLAMGVVEHLIGGDEAGGGGAARLRSVTESAVLLEKRRALGSCRFVRRRAETEEGAGRSGAVLLGHLLIRGGLLVAGLTGGLDFLANCDACQKQSAEQSNDASAAGAAIPFQMECRRGGAMVLRIAAQCVPVQTRPVGWESSGVVSGCFSRRGQVYKEGRVGGDSRRVQSHGTEPASRLSEQPARRSVDQFDGSPSAAFHDFAAAGVDEGGVA